MSPIESGRSEMRTPPSLLERLRGPDRAAAWERFTQLYSPLLFYWARKTGLQEHDAADLVQEVLALLVRKLPDFQYEAGGSFRGWLRMVLLNKWREARRRRQLPIDADACLPELPAPGTDNLLADDDYHLELLRRALNVLKADFQTTTWEAFWRTAVLGQPAHAVALELGMSPGAVHVARFRVLKRLRQELEGLVD